MRAIEEQAIVVELACLTADRTKVEQRALRNTARRIDNERNLVSSSNPRMAEALLTMMAVDPSEWPACTYSADHNDKGAGKCACVKVANERRGFFVNPPDGWSRLEQQVIDTWEPET